MFSLEINCVFIEFYVLIFIFIIYVGLLWLEINHKFLFITILFETKYPIPGYSVLLWPDILGYFIAATKSTRDRLYYDTGTLAAA